MTQKSVESRRRGDGNKMLPDNMNRRASDGKQNCKGKREKNYTPPSKVVIRRLPPLMTEDDFREAIAPVPDNDYFAFFNADKSLGPQAFTRAYINFKVSEEIFIFRDKFDGYIFLDQTGNEYPAMVEYSSFQKIPKQNIGRKDVRCGTIDEDPDYVPFLESLQNPEPVSLPGLETLLEEIENEERELRANNGVVKIKTPLLEYIEQRKADKIRTREERREERRKKEFERKKTREDDKRRRKDVVKDLGRKREDNNRDEYLGRKREDNNRDEWRYERRDDRITHSDVYNNTIEDAKSRVQRIKDKQRKKEEERRERERERREKERMRREERIKRHEERMKQKEERNVSYPEHGKYKQYDGPRSYPVEEKPKFEGAKSKRYSEGRRKEEREKERRTKEENDEKEMGVETESEARNNDHVNKEMDFIEEKFNEDNPIDDVIDEIKEMELDYEDVDNELDKETIIIPDNNDDEVINLSEELDKYKLIEKSESNSLVTKSLMTIEWEADDKYSSKASDDSEYPSISSDRKSIRDDDSDNEREDTKSPDEISEETKDGEKIPRSKRKDPRMERRIRNKDRPAMQIYRPGQSRLSIRLRQAQEEAARSGISGGEDGGRNGGEDGGRGGGVGCEDGIRSGGATCDTSSSSPSPVMPSAVEEKQIVKRRAKSYEESKRNKEIRRAKSIEDRKNDGTNDDKEENTPISNEVDLDKCEEDKLDIATIDTKESSDLEYTFYENKKIIDDNNCKVDLHDNDPEILGDSCPIESLHKEDIIKDISIPQTIPTIEDNSEEVQITE